MTPRQEKGTLAWKLGSLQSLPDIFGEFAGDRGKYAEVLVVITRM
jgi:hypothetical protein